MSHEAPHWALVQIKDGDQWVTYESRCPCCLGFENPTTYRWKASALYEEAVASRYEARVVVPTWTWDWEAKAWRYLPTDNVLYQHTDDLL